VSQAEIVTVGHGEHYETPPFAIPSKKLVMWLFIISDAVTFGAMLYGYGYLRNASSNWPSPFKFSPSIINVMIMTFVLITSSLTMLIGVRKAQAGDKSGSIKWTFITVFLGIVFAGLHLNEWRGMIAEGVTLAKKPVGFTTIRGRILLNHRAALDPRHRRRDRPYSGRPRLQTWPL